MTSVYAVIVTYNGADDIRPCLSSVQDSTIPVQTLVVDNNSTDETVEIIRRDFPNVKMMCSPDNLGFGKGNNIGIKHAYKSGAEHIFLLNQDAYVEPDTISRLVEMQSMNKDYALLSPMQLDGSGRQLDSLFAIHLSKSSSVGKILTDSFVAEKHAPLYEVDFLNAAAWMLSRKCVEQVGLFNPIFEHYGEDLEFAHRVQQKGHKIGLCTDAIAYHNRPQNQNGNLDDLRKNIMLGKAVIRYRLSRKKPGTVTNMMSALSRAVFVQYKNKRESMILRLQLLGFLITVVWKTLKMRDKGYGSLRAFFDVTPDCFPKYIRNMHNEILK
jgi:GT2 family glycosyltransferase